ncbi:hypothetical protein F2P79_022158 [Pimephales promelas]|nr:hypothetical protein F2P79_022158 [Pimephales promelas]
MGTNLGLHSQVQWFGRGGLCWRDLLSFFKQCLKGRTPPNVLVIHCGGNDLGRVMSVLLVNEMKDLREINVKFPQMKIVFSSINQRRHWRHAPPVKLEKMRKFVNNIMAKFVPCVNGCIVLHGQIIGNETSSERAGRSNARLSGIWHSHAFLQIPESARSAHGAVSNTVRGRA